MTQKAAITLLSFGFKYGPPRANYYFDVGFVKNPARSEKWGFFSKADEEMRRFVLEQKEIKVFLFLIKSLIKHLSNIDAAQVYAFGCSAGRHRSPIIVEELASTLRLDGYMVRVIHRDAEATPAPCPEGAVSWRGGVWAGEGWSPCVPGEWIPCTEDGEEL